MKIFRGSSVNYNVKFPYVCKAVKDYKTGKGRDEMCDAVEEYARKQALEVVKSFIAAGANDEMIKKATNLTDEEIEKLRSELS